MSEPHPFAGGIPLEIAAVVHEVATDHGMRAISNPNPATVFCQDCGVIREGCICKAKKEHKPDCRFLKAARLSVELACEHGFQACPICDPCSCGIEGLEGIR